MQYHYADQDNQVIGPIDGDELHALHRRGMVTLETNVFPEGDTDWRPYHTLVTLPPPPPQSLAPVVYAPPAIQVNPQFEPVVAATKTCPFCAEEIAIHAKKCKHCGEVIDVVLRAAEEAKRASNAKPMVFMNAGGGSSSAAAVNTRPSVVIVGGQKSGFAAALLNLLIPGLGYMYCGRVLLGCMVFLFTVVVAAATGGIIMLVLYPLYFIDGFLAAGRANRRLIKVV